MHLKLKLGGETYTFSNRKRREKKIFSIKRMTLLDNGSLAPCWTSAADARTKEKKNSWFTFIAANLRQNIK